MKLRKFVPMCPEIVITGGPCADKTEGMKYWKKELELLGYKVFVIPEVATYFLGGIKDYHLLGKTNPEANFQIQQLIVNIQMALRIDFHKLASKFPGKCVILSDRGVLDQFIYTPAHQHQELLRVTGVDMFEARDSYAGVIHSVTAANGAVEYYTCVGNETRTEGLELAIARDILAKKAWTGVEHLRVIDNSTNLETKRKRILRAILKILGVPNSFEIEKRYLVKSFPDFKANNVYVQKLDIEQKYLILDDGSNSRIRRSSQWEYSTFYKTEKYGVGLVRDERNAIINRFNYSKLGEKIDPKTKPLKKDRHCFLYKNQYFQFDDIYSPKQVMFLEIELDDKNDKVCLPPFVEIVKEVTDDPSCSNYAISKG